MEGFRATVWWPGLRTVPRREPAGRPDPGGEPAYRVVFGLLVGVVVKLSRESFASLERSGPRWARR